MNEGINNDMQKVSLASVFESAKADKQRETNDNKLEEAMNEVDEQKEVKDNQKEIKDNQLEEAMNEVDDKRTEIGNLSEKKTNLTENQNSLSESLNSIKNNVKVFKESKQNLKDLYQKAKSDSDLEAFLKENGIESWEDLTKSEEFAKTDEVSSFSKAKEDIKKSVEGRKSQEEKVREEYGLDESFKGTKLEGKISEEKTKVESEIEKLRPETPEGQSEIKNEAKNESEKKMNLWFDKQIKSKINQSLETGNFVMFQDCNLINEAVDLSKEARVLNKTPEELWKQFYEQKIDEIIQKNEKIQTELDALVKNSYLTVQKEDWGYTPGDEFSPSDSYSHDLKNVDFLVRNLKTSEKNGYVSGEKIGIFYSKKLESENKSYVYEKINKDEKGICSVSILNKKAVEKYQQSARDLVWSLQRTSRIVNNHGILKDVKVNTLFNLINEKEEIEDLKLNFYGNESLFKEAINTGKEALVVLTSLDKDDLTKVEISKDLYNFLTSEENKGKSINKIKLEFDSKSEKQKQRQTLLKEKIPSKIYLEQLQKEYQKMGWSSEESKVATEEKQNRGEKIEEAKSLINELKNFSLNFNSNSLRFDGEKLVPNIKYVFDDGTYPWHGSEWKSKEIDSKIAELKERKADRNLFQGKLKKEDEMGIEKLETEKKELKEEQNNHI